MKHQSIVDVLFNLDYVEYNTAWRNKLETKLQKLMVLLRHSTQLNDLSPNNLQPLRHCAFQTSVVSATAPLHLKWSKYLSDLIMKYESPL